MSEHWTWLWIPATIFAAITQVGRNTIQLNLTATLGTIGATQIRFLYGFPFAIFFTCISILITGEDAPIINKTFLFYIFIGASSQILGTVLMLAAMQKSSFVVVTAWLKTEPIQVAIFGLIFLRDRLTVQSLVAIIIATIGVIIISNIRTPNATTDLKSRWHPTVLGLFAAASLAIASIGYRAAILALGNIQLIVGATFSLATALGIQTLILIITMRVFYPALWKKCLAEWRLSIWGGLLSASSSLGLFIGLALTSAANVRTLGLIEVLFAQFVSWQIFHKKISSKQIAGIILVLAGVTLLLLSE
jgi:drug/metabolite transporter (DMT)-like permease